VFRQPVDGWVLDDPGDIADAPPSRHEAWTLRFEVRMSSRDPRRTRGLDYAGSPPSRHTHGWCATEDQARRLATAEMLGGMSRLRAVMDDLEAALWRFAAATSFVEQPRATQEAMGYLPQPARIVWWRPAEMAEMVRAARVETAYVENNLTYLLDVIGRLDPRDVVTIRDLMTALSRDGFPPPMTSAAQSLCWKAGCAPPARR
jgi:hypothetical protein